MPLVPSKCPLCGGVIEVVEVSCLECDAQIRSHWTLARFDRLDAEQVRFLETFLRCRGVIRDMEAALGISYPTVRARLDALLTALELNEGQEQAAPAPEDKTARRKEILAAIQAGTVSADAGLQALQEL